MRNPPAGRLGRQERFESKPRPAQAKRQAPEVFFQRSSGREDLLGSAGQRPSLSCRTSPPLGGRLAVTRAFANLRRSRIELGAQPVEQNGREIALREGRDDDDEDLALLLGPR